MAIHPYLRMFALLVVPRQPAKALEIAWWWITRRRVRALNRLRLAAADMPEAYGYWRALNQPGPGVRADGLLALHLHVGLEASSDMATEALLSILTQPGDAWEIHVTMARDSAVVLPDDPRICVMSVPVDTRAGGLTLVLDVIRASHVVPLSADCTLTPGVLPVLAQAVASGEPAGIFYADQDERGAQGERVNPWLKPQWDADLFLSQDYVSQACALPVDAARRTGIDPQWPDDVVVAGLVERLMQNLQAPSPLHVPIVAVTTPARAWQRSASARRAMMEELTGLPVHEGLFGTLVIDRPLPCPAPRVSVIVPTRDRLDLLETCISGVLNNTDYPDLELIVADNESVEPETLAYFATISRDPRVKVVRWPHPYNYSAINNFAVTQANGAFLCLLNNDTEVVDPAWLRRMAAHAARPGVGAVGARLLYPDHSVQHAGVVVGMGGAAGHAHRGLLEGEPGYFAQALVTREATAVTAACLVVSRKAFEAVGGLDEIDLAIAYNDVDLCLRLKAAGLRNIYEAQAVLIHHESKSRGQDFAPEHVARYNRELAVFQKRWDSIGFIDPVHHPGLDPISEIYRLRI